MVQGQRGDLLGQTMEMITAPGKFVMGLTKSLSPLFAQGAEGVEAGKPEIDPIPDVTPVADLARSSEGAATFTPPVRQL